MIKYWLWSDDSDEIENYGIFEYTEVPFDENVPFEEAKVKKIIFTNCTYVEVGDNYELFQNAITSDPKRILKFLFAKEF